MALAGKSLADAYITVRADMSSVAGDVARGTDRAVASASKSTSRGLKDAITTPFREGFVEAAKAADPGGAAVGGRIRTGLVGKLRGITADTVKVGADAGTGIDKGVASKMAGVAATTTRAGRAAGDGFTKAAGKATEEGGGRLARAAKSTAGNLLSGFAVAAVGMSAIHMFAGFIADARESEKVGKLTAQVILSTGGAAKLTAADISALATSVSNKTGVDDEAIQSGENLLLTFTSIRNEAGKGNDVFTRATGIMTDMSVALGQDMKSSAIQLGKALNDPIKGVSALQRVGVSFTASQKDQIKTMVKSGDVLGAQKVILAELGKEFGGAAAAAATPTDRLRVIVGNLGEQIGTALLPAIDSTARVLADDVVPALSVTLGFLGKIPGPVYAIIAAAAGVLLFGKAVAAIKAQAAAASLGIQGLGISAAATGRALALMSLAGGVVILAAVAVQISAMAAAALTAKVNTGELDTAMARLGQTGQASGAAIGVFRQGWGPFSQDVHTSSQAMDAFGNIARGALGGANEGMGEWIGRMQSGSDRTARLTEITGQYDASLARLAGSGQLKTATDAFDKLMEAARKQGVNVDDVRAMFPQYTAAVQAAGVAAGGATGPTAGLAAAAAAAGLGLAKHATTLGDLTARYPDFKKQIDAAVGAETVASGATAVLTAAQVAAATAAVAHSQALKNLTDSLTASNNAMLVLRGGETGYYAALDAATAAVRTNGRTLDVHSEKGRANRAVLDSLSTAGLGYLDVIQKNTGVGPKFRSTLDQQWTKLYDAQIRFGATKAEAKRYADQIYATPKALALKVTTPGLDSARSKVQGLAGDISHLSSKELKIALRSAGDLPSKLQIYAQLKNMWTGGYTGDGGKYEPKGVVHGGEFVVPKEQTARIGVPRLAALVGLPGYAGGGPVARNLTVRGSVDRAWPPAGSVGRWADAAVGGIQKMMEVVAAHSIASSGGGAGGGSGTMVGNVGSGVTRWTGLVLRALAMMGQSPNLLSVTLRRMNQESGGNPNAINLWDSNAKAGDPSRGLMQTIMGTFRAYHYPGTSNNIYDPLANVLASMRYALSAYGSLFSAYGRPGGYAAGTTNAARGLAWVGESGRELVQFGGGETVHTAAASRALDAAGIGAGGDGLVRLHPDTIKALGGVLAHAMARQPIVLDGATVAGYVDRSLGRSSLSVRG